jgi:hypothetical protein
MANVVIVYIDVTPDGRVDSRWFCTHECWQIVEYMYTVQLTSLLLLIHVLVPACAAAWSHRVLSSNRTCNFCNCVLNCYSGPNCSSAELFRDRCLAQVPAE